MSTPNRRLLILSCSKTKRLDDTRLPALERYDGPFFRVLRRWQRANPSASLDALVLSARFGLISASQPISVYDQQMNAKRALELHSQVMNALKQALVHRPYEALCICMGQGYRQALDGYEALIQPGIRVTVCTGTIGRMLATLRDWLYGFPPKAYTPQSTDAHPGPARIRGVEIAMTPGEIRDTARQVLADESVGRVGRYGPSDYQSWYIEIDGHRVSPKWLVSQLTGLPVSAFVTDEARRVLSQLGVEVKRV